jgi:hypothetical protein
MPIELLKDGSSRFVPAVVPGMPWQAAAPNDGLGLYSHRTWGYLWQQCGGGESELKEALVESLADLFVARHECRGTHYDIQTGKESRLRVDLILEPWPDSGFTMGPIAVELKHPCRNACRDLGDHIKQAIDYRQTVWDGYGRLPVFLCPGLQSFDCLRPRADWELNREFFETMRVIGSLGMGEAFVNPRTRKSTLLMTADMLVCNSCITKSGRRRSKRGHGIGSSNT